MNKLFVTLLCALLSASLSFAAVEQAPLQVRSNMGLLNITSLHESLQIRNIIVNRKNCTAIIDISEKNRSFGFGESVLVTTITRKDDNGLLYLTPAESGKMSYEAGVAGGGMCRILEVQIETNQGSWVFRFNQ